MKKKIRKTLTIVCLAAILAFAQLLWAQPVATNCTPAPGGIVSWWPADGYALDVVGTNNTTLEDGAGYTEGEVGQAFHFNGSNSYVFLPINFFPFPLSGTGTEPFTIELWFRTTSGGVVFSQEAGPVGGSFSGSDPGIYVGTDGKLRAEVFWSGSVNPMTSSSVVNDGVFHHTAVTYDGTNAVLFLDGKSIQTNKQSQVGYAVAYYYQFGVAYTAKWPGGNGGWYYFNGLIDEPALYSRALNSSEIAAIYEAGAAGKCFSNTAPVLIQQPVSVTANPNDNATFTVVATGIAPYSYQWQFDGTNIAGATNSVLNLTNIQMSNAGAYSVIVANADGTAKSIDATLVVLCSAVIFFEDFESGRLPAQMTVSTVGGFNTSPGIQSLTNFGGSKAFGFGLSDCPASCFNAHVTTLTINLPAPTYVSDLSFDEMELYGNWGSYGEVLVDGVWGSGTQDFGRIPNNDGQADTTYRTHYFEIDQIVTNVSLRVTDITDVSEIFAGDIALTAFSSNAPTILTQPESLTLFNGATAKFAVMGTSTVPISYQWSLGGTNLIGATNAALSISNVSLADAGDYQVSLANCSGSTVSQIATLTIPGTPSPPIITQQPVSVVTNKGANVTFTVAATSTATLFYQWQVDSNNIVGATDSTLTLTNVQLSQSGSSYSVIVTNVSGVTNSSDAILTVYGPPVIVQQPSNFVTYQGGQALFIVVVATNFVSPSYQWLYEGSNLVGQTGSTLTLTNVQVGQGGNYSVVVSNPAGPTPSSNATLTVLQHVPPQISIVSPTPGSVFNTGSPVTITASVIPGSGLITNVDFYDGASLLGQVNQSPYTFVWTNAPQGTPSLTAVALANDRLSATSSPVSISVIVPINKPAITLVSPANQSTFCAGTPIPLVATVTGGSSAPTSVSFYADSTALLGSVPAVSDSAQWTNAAEGSYSVTAVATFPDGSTLTSPAAEVTISSQCGQVAIVSGAVTSEISLMENGLSNRMGLTYAVFTPAEATVGVLTPYKLVIWDDLDGGTNQIADSTVAVLANLFGAGIPLYLIGPHLAQDALALSPSEQSQWIGLTGLTPATGVGGDGGVEFTNSSQSDPIVDGSFGTAANFAAAADFDLTTVTNSSATVVAQSGAVPVMVAYPGFGVASGQARRVTQNFEVGGGSDTNSLAQRQTLFLNAVCWLTDCSICTLVGVAPKADVTPNPAIVGAPVTLNWTVANDGDCAGTGVVLSCPLPAGAQFVGAAADSGGSQYDSLQNQVVFELGQLPRGSVSVSYTLIFQQGGVFTNTMNVSVIGIPPVQAQTTVQVNGLNLLPTGASGYQMQFTGNASQTYQIQTSTDLINWLNWSNIVGPNWQITLPAPSPTGPPRQFYRALEQ